MVHVKDVCIQKLGTGLCVQIINPSLSKGAQRLMRDADQPCGLTHGAVRLRIGMRQRMHCDSDAHLCTHSTLEMLMSLRFIHIILERYL